MPAMSATTTRPVKRLEVTNENLRRVFGMDQNAMFQTLAKRLGYDLEG